ncbi:hypothetical protein A9Q84_05100 [Halobacteriovorax marinus]|uniref:NAD-dependent epimerase/dehydratase domain-containing protein n=1 Tax=Halobacteriovorax marinus TaxID=97084 RepID=A0A1Y5FGG8_9BACT|nr:hypothetical protein A9Q84_05100 [Halobacteriovorax marinus]
MNILFTGASSFTGHWFVQELRKAGHTVFATLTKSSIEDYSGIRKTRLENLAEHCNFIYNCSFGSDKFLEAIDGDVLFGAICHHAHDNTNYRSPDYDSKKAVKRSTHNINQVLAQAKNKNRDLIFILTGTVIEIGEGDPSDEGDFSSPYGASKHECFEIVKSACEKSGVRLGKFVIPNPFGPYEEDRFTTYLMNSWRKSETPFVRTPDYIRDNIHVSLLAIAYAYFLNEVVESELSFEKNNPSQYRESQRDFAIRFIKEMEKRFSFSCPIAYNDNAKYSDPIKRVNIHDAAESFSAEWDEDSAWDQIADFYKILYKIN